MYQGFPVKCLLILSCYHTIHTNCLLDYQVVQVHQDWSEFLLLKHFYFYNKSLGYSGGGDESQFELRFLKIYEELLEPLIRIRVCFFKTWPQMYSVNSVINKTWDRFILFFVVSIILQLFSQCFSFSKPLVICF